jgi:hypothetical protein
MKKDPRPILLGDLGDLGERYSGSPSPPQRRHGLGATGETGKRMRDKYLSEWCTLLRATTGFDSSKLLPPHVSSARRGQLVDLVRLHEHLPVVPFAVACKEDVVVRTQHKVASATIVILQSDRIGPHSFANLYGNAAADIPRGPGESQAI